MLIIVVFLSRLSANLGPCPLSASMLWTVRYQMCHAQKRTSSRNIGARVCTEFLVKGVFANYWVKVTTSPTLASPGVGLWVYHWQ